MKSAASSGALSNAYERVLASVGAPLSLIVGAIDSACILKAARRYCGSLFLPQPCRGVIAGGFIRDSLLGVMPNDLDLYAPPNECAKLARRLELAGWKLQAANSARSAHRIQWECRGVHSKVRFDNLLRITGSTAARRSLRSCLSF
jgi:hypothetical protein